MEQLVGEQFVEWLKEHIKHEFSHWPIIQGLSVANLQPQKLRKLMIQWFFVQSAFWGSKEGDPGFLGFAIGNLSESDDPEAETALEILVTRKNQEQILQPQQHLFWHQLLLVLGAPEEEIQKTKPKEITRHYIAELSDLYSNAAWQTVAGGLAAYDWIGNLINQVIIDLSKKAVLNPGSLEPKSNMDAGHLLEKTIFDPQNKHLVWLGTKKQLDLHQEFLIGLKKYL